MPGAVVTPRSAQYDATGVAFSAYGKRFRESAITLLKAPRNPIYFDPVPYFLLCQSLELHLKGFIWKVDRIPWGKLKEMYGHDIMALWRDAKQKRIHRIATPTKIRDDVIAFIGPYYKQRRFNYLDLDMAFRGYDLIESNRRVIPTLLKLTDVLGQKMSGW